MSSIVNLLKKSFVYYLLNSFAKEVSCSDESDSNMEEIDSGTVAPATSCISRVKKLKEMFPNKAEDELENSFINNMWDVSNSVNDLVLPVPLFTSNNKKKTSTEIISVHKFLKFESFLSHQQEKLMGERQVIQVTSDDVLIDLLSHYKSGKFDASNPIKIRYMNYPAADTGGVLHQCFTDAFDQFISKWFVGNNSIKLPAYRSDILITKVFLYFGKMLSHSISQNGPGIAVFPRSVFEYLVSGSFEDATPYLTSEDMVGAHKAYYATQVLFIAQFLFFKQY